MTDQATVGLRKRLEGLAAFLRVFKSPEFSFGAWEGRDKSEDGSVLMPHYALSAEADAFVRAAYDLGWVMEDFDWPEWKGIEEAERLRDDPEALANATSDQLAKLLTVLICQERFVEGGLAAAFESGLLTGILWRAQVLKSEE